MDHATECDMRTALCEIRNALYDMGALFRGALYDMGTLYNIIM